MSLLDTASLIVTPNGYKEGTLYSVIPSDGSGDMNVVRATTATRVNSAGLVELVPYNLLKYSQEFDNSSYWSYYQSTITANNTTAPDGTMTADRLNQSFGTGGNVVVSTANNNAGNVTLSAYLKKGNGADGVVALNDGSWKNGFFNLTLGTVTYVDAGVTASITDAGNGWWRCSITINANTNSVVTNIGHILNTGEFGYIWGAQLNEGSLKDYQKTETRLNIPRLDYSNGTCPSLLVEPQRTNRVLYSSSLDNGAYSLGGTGTLNVTPNYAISPDGTMSADRVQITRGSVYEEFFQRILTTIGQTYTLSFWAKSLSGTSTLYTAFNDGYQNEVTFTTDWVRYEYTFTGAGAFGSGFNLITWSSLPTTSTSADLLVWGVQLELGSYATSYIPTTSASVTRNADVVSKTGISSLIGQTEGTIFIDLDFTDASITMLLQLFDGVSDVMAIYTGGNSVFFDGSNGSAQWSISGSLANGHHKLAIAYKTNDIAVYIDGVLIGTDTSAAIPTTDRMYLNGNVSGSFIEKQYYNSVALWKTRLTNTQLAQLTTI